jgi:hypothetical protein
MSNALPSLTNTCISNGTNGVLIDQVRDLLYVTVRFEPKVCVFSVPSLAFQLEITTGGTSRNSEPNLGILELPSSRRQLYISYDDEVFIHDAITGEELGRFNPERGLEELAGDDFNQVLYIPDENDRTGIYVYDPVGKLRGSFAGGGIFASDAEGTVIYTCPSDGMTDNGRGFIVVSDLRSRDPGVSGLGPDRRGQQHRRHRLHSTDVSRLSHGPLRRHRRR